MDQTRRLIALDIPPNWLHKKQEVYYWDGTKGDSEKSTNTADIRSDLIEELPGPEVTSPRLDATKEWATNRSDLDTGSYFSDNKYMVALRRIIDRALSIYGLFDPDEYHKHPVLIRSIYEEGVWPEYGSMSYPDVASVMTNAGYKCELSGNHVSRCAKTFDIENQESQDDIPAKYDIEYFRHHYIKKEDPDTQRELTKRINDATDGLDIKIAAVGDRIDLFGISTDQSETTSIKHPDKFLYRHYYLLRPATASGSQQLDKSDLDEINIDTYRGAGTNRHLRTISDMVESSDSDKDITRADKDEIKDAFESGDERDGIEAVATEYGVPTPLAETALIFHGVIQRYRYKKLVDTPAMAEGSTTGGDLTNTKEADFDYGRSGALAKHYVYQKRNMYGDDDPRCPVEETANELGTSEGVVRFAIKYYRGSDKVRWRNPELEPGQPTDATLDAPDGSGRITDPEYLDSQINDENQTPRDIKDKHGYTSADTVRQLANMYHLDTPIKVGGFGPDDDTIEVDSYPERAVGYLLKSLHGHSPLSDKQIECKYIGRLKKEEHIELDMSGMDCDKDIHPYTPDYRIDIGNITVYVEAKGDKDNVNFAEANTEISDRQKAEAMMNALDDDARYVTITDGVDLGHYDHDYRFGPDPASVDETTDDVLEQGDDAFAEMILDIAPKQPDLFCFIE